LISDDAYMVIFQRMCAQGNALQTRGHNSRLCKLSLSLIYAIFV